MAILGQKGPTTAGTPVIMSATAIGPGTYMLWPNPANSGTYMYLGHTSQTATSAAGLVLKKEVNDIAITVVDIADLWINSDGDGNTVCWCLVEGQNIGKRAPVSW